MPLHSRPWRRGSLFTAGPRNPLDREQRAVWRARVELFRRAGRITALHAAIALALARRLSVDGRCDPSHDTIASDAGASPRTVRRALAALADCGLVRWIRRLVRPSGWQAVQTSNAYALMVSSAPVSSAVRHDGQADRQTVRKILKPYRPASNEVGESVFDCQQRQLAQLVAIMTDEERRSWEKKRPAVGWVERQRMATDLRVTGSR